MSGGARPRRPREWSHYLLPQALHSAVADGDQPAWSPDGKKIAFQSAGRKGGEMFVMNADGGGVTLLTEGPSDEPAWSHDSAKIVFHSLQGGQHGGEIWIMNAKIRADCFFGHRGITAQLWSSKVELWNRHRGLGALDLVLRHRVSTGDLPLPTGRQVPQAGSPWRELLKGKISKTKELERNQSLSR